MDTMVTANSQMTFHLLVVMRVPAIHVLDNKWHWRVGFVARGGVDVGVSLAVIKLPGDGLWVDFGHSDGQLGGRGGGTLLL